MELEEENKFMEKIVIYGAGNTGKSAYYCLKKNYDVCFFVDSDSKLWGGKIDNLLIKSPDTLKSYRDVRVVVASIYKDEILETLKEFGFHKITIYRPSIEWSRITEVNELNERTIDLGAFLCQQNELYCKELTFMIGGSLVLDYMFLKTIAKTFGCKSYLEIGTYIGESINVLTDCCESLYSITADPKGAYSVGETWCKPLNFPDYGERLAYSEKIKHFYGDSKSFDYKKIEEDIDLFFIDGDHSYEGVYADTLNIFNVKKENAIVIWHDFRTELFRYKEEIVAAVKDALGDKFENVYVTNGNLCGIYLPDAMKSHFTMRRLKYEEAPKLYTYDVTLTNCKVM